MKSQLHFDAVIDPTNKAARLALLGRCIGACQRGDFRARTHLARLCGPLIRSIAEKRGARTPAEINRLCALGREGLYEAAHRYRPKIGVAHFPVFALRYIEQAMRHDEGGFWQRLFHFRHRHT